MAEAVASFEGVKVGRGKVGEGSVEKEMVGAGGDNRRAGEGESNDGG